MLLLRECTIYAGNLALQFHRPFSKFIWNGGGILLVSTNLTILPGFFLIKPIKNTHTKTILATRRQGECGNGGLLLLTSDEINRRALRPGRRRRGVTEAEEREHRDADEEHGPPPRGVIRSGGASGAGRRGKDCGSHPPGAAAAAGWREKRGAGRLRHRRRE